MKIILATDGTRHSEAALEMAGKLDLGPGDEIVVISVLDMAVPTTLDITGGYLPNTADIEAAGRENATHIAEDAAKQLVARFGPKGVTISSDVLFGSPDSRIVEAAGEHAADLIVMGSHVHNRIERLLLGSVSDSVVRHAHCSVLIVRTSEDK